MVTVPDEKPNPEYIAAWDDLRNRQRAYWFGWIGGFLFMAAIGFSGIAPG